MKIFDALLDAKTSADVENIIQQLGDTISWTPIGNNPGNYGVISMGSEPYDGITERITNSMDALIELGIELVPQLKNITSPRKASEIIFGIKEGNLKCIESEMMGELASKIKVKFLDGDSQKEPTIEIWDSGIGQHPEDFPETLLGLNRDYKVSKFYLIGAFGQGGQTSFHHCKYGIIISRKHPNLLRKNQQDMVGWSIVRYRDPSTKEQFYKRGFWEYCIETSTNKILTLEPVNLRKIFEHGTIIRMIAYDLPRGAGDVLQPANTAWGFLSQSLFDPVLPIRLFEERHIYENRNRPLYGLAPRLWGGGKGEKVQIGLNDSYDIDLKRYGKLKINYWTLRPTEEYGWKDVKKGFVSGSNAIFITMSAPHHKWWGILKG
ncbi:MAG: hypothetical protein HZB92_03085 [Euryarchaeota archaeon]|nr:hypothetical protein [Euryarchaeota archaeon]